MLSLISFSICVSLQVFETWNRFQYILKGFEIIVLLLMPELSRSGAQLNRFPAKNTSWNVLEFAGNCFGYFDTKISDADCVMNGRPLSV